MNKICAQSLINDNNLKLLGQVMSMTLSLSNQRHHKDNYHKERKNRMSSLTKSL